MGYFIKKQGKKKYYYFEAIYVVGQKYQDIIFLQITGLTNKMPRLSCKEFKIIFLTQITRKIMRIVGTYLSKIK